MNISVADIAAFIFSTLSLILVWYKAPKEKQKIVSSTILDYANATKAYADEVRELKEQMKSACTLYESQIAQLNSDLAKRKEQEEIWQKTIVECTKVNVALKKYVRALIRQLKENNIQPCPPEDGFIGEIEL